jgi:hypothetical protein
VGPTFPGPPFRPSPSPEAPPEDTQAKGRKAAYQGTASVELGHGDGRLGISKAKAKSALAKFDRRRRLRPDRTSGGG